MRAIPFFALLAGFAILLSGCAQSLEKAVVGKYRAEVDVSGLPEKEKKMAEQISAFIGNVTYEIKEGGKSTATIMGQPQEGQWTLEGSTLTVKPAQGEPVKFKVEEGGKKLVPDLTEEQNKMMQGAKIWFKKE